MVCLWPSSCKLLDLLLMCCPHGRNRCDIVNAAVSFNCTLKIHYLTDVLYCYDPKRELIIMTAGRLMLQSCNIAFKSRTSPRMLDRGQGYTFSYLLCNTVGPHGPEEVKGEVIL